MCNQFIYTALNDTSNEHILGAKINTNKIAAKYNKTNSVSFEQFGDVFSAAVCLSCLKLFLFLRSDRVQNSKRHTEYGS